MDRDSLDEMVGKWFGIERGRSRQELYQGFMKAMKEDLGMMRMSALTNKTRRASQRQEDAQRNLLLSADIRFQKCLHQRECECDSLGCTALSCLMEFFKRVRGKEDAGFTVQFDGHDYVPMKIQEQVLDQLCDELEKSRDEGLR